MSEISTKMDAIIGIQIQMVSLQKDVDHQHEIAARSNEIMADMRKRVGEVESSLLSTKSVVRGALAVGVLLFGFAQWYILGQLATLEQIVKDSRTMERRLFLIEQSTKPKLKESA